MEFAAWGFCLSFSEDCTTTPSLPSDKNLLEISGHIIDSVIGSQCPNCHGQAGVFF